MKLQFKIILIIVPFVFMSIFGLGYLSYRTIKIAAHESVEKYMDGILDIYISQSVRPQYELLIDNHLDSIPSSVQAFKDESAELINKLPLPWDGHFIIVTGDGEYVHCSIEMSKEDIESVWGALAKEIHREHIEKVTGYANELDVIEFYRAAHFDPWNWYVFVSVDSDVVNGASADIRKNAAFLSVFAAVLLSVLIVFYTRKLVLKPIGVLSEAAVEIGKTRKKITIGFDNNDEISLLAAELESMSSEIEEYDEKNIEWHTELENQVEERTKELHGKNTLLNNEIEHRRQVQNELMSTMKKLEDMVNGTDNLVTVVASDGHYVFVNPAAEKILGKEPDEMIGKLAFDDIYEDDKDYTVSHFQGWLKDKVVNATMENRLVHKDGSVRTMQWNVFLNYDENKELININSIARDVTSAREAELKLMEYAEKLEQTNNDIKSFAYIVSHDLRAPLVNLQGFVSELGYDLESLVGLSEKYMPVIEESDQQLVRELLKEDIPESMSFIKTAVQKMDNLINSVLNLSRLGRKELVFEEVDTSEVMQNISTTLTHQLTSKEIDLIIDKLPVINADAVSISQIFSNLISNSIKFMKENGEKRISVSSEPYESGYLFTVEDTGIGMSSSFQEKVFNLFSREEYVKTEGDGMGLTYVEKIVSRHNGKVWCESEQGKGSKFYVYLPKNRD